MSEETVDLDELDRLRQRVTCDYCCCEVWQAYPALAAEIRRLRAMTEETR